MGKKTSVAGNRVTIEDAGYEIREAGTARFAVSDEFGVALGYFMLEGKTIKADDFGAYGAHSLIRIARLWLNASGPPVEKPSAMVCRVTRSTGASEADVPRAKAHATWLKTQSGNRAAFVTFDAASGAILGVSVWANRGRLAAALALDPPAAAAERPGAEIEITQLAQDL